MARYHLSTTPFGTKLTGLEVANFLRIHPTTVYKLAKRRELPAVKIAGDWRFDRVQIERWVRSRMRGT